jgi:hypothetical protein
MLPRLFAFLILISTAFQPAIAKERAELELERIQSTAQREAQAAQSDFDLVSNAGLAMHWAYRAGGPNMAAVIDASLKQLRTKFPDKRLRYTNEQDRCRIFDAFSDIRQDALYRAQRALNVVHDAAMRLAIYHLLSADITLANATGEPITTKRISDTFLKTINSEAELAVFASNNAVEGPSDTSTECD